VEICLGLGATSRGRNRLLADVRGRKRTAKSWLGPLNELGGRKALITSKGTNQKPLSRTTLGERGGKVLEFIYLKKGREGGAPDSSSFSDHEKKGESFIREKVTLGGESSGHSIG